MNDGEFPKNNKKQQRMNKPITQDQIQESNLNSSF